MTEPTRVTGKRPAARRVFSKRPSGFVAPQSKIHEGYSPSSRLAIRPFAGKQHPRVVFKQALTLLALALGFLFVEGCRTANTSNRAWGSTPPEDNRPGYESADDAPLGMDARH